MKKATGHLPGPAKRSRVRSGPGIREVAKAASVSVSTVSRALRGYRDVSHATREHVRRIADELGYKPHVVGQSLVSGRANNIGVLLSARHGPALLTRFYSEVLAGVEMILAEHELNLLLMRLKDSVDVGRVINGMVDGIIALGCDLPEGALRQVHDAGMPLVLIDRQSWHHEIPSVTVQNEHGATLAARHLLGQGRRRLAFVADNLDDLNFRLRRAGFEQALKQAGLSADSSRIVAGPSGAGSGYEAVAGLLEHTVPEGIVFANDIAALSGLKALSEAGLRVPEDVAVVGFDDLELAQYSRPALTTIRVSRIPMGQESVRRLLQRMNGEPADSLVLPVELVIRDSSESRSEL